jgi:threonine aldolase
MFADKLYFEIGRSAVQHAIRIREAFRAAGHEVVIESPTNQQFFRLPNVIIDRLHERISFNYWGPRGTTHSIVRFVTGWSTTADDIDRLIELLQDL